MEDAIVDAFRFTAMVLHSMMWTTGTPIDIVRDLLAAAIQGSQKTDDKRGIERMWRAYDEIGSWIEGMRRGKCAGLDLKPREHLPTEFYVVAWTHYVILAFCIAFPLLFSREQGFDLLFLAFIFIVVIHWFYFCGECIFSYFEKKLFYEKYKIGSMTNLHWFNDTLPWQVTLVLILTCVLGINASIATVIMRNVSIDYSLTATSASVVLKFR